MERNDDDPLRPAQGIIISIFISAWMWAVLIYFFAGDIARIVGW